VSDLVSRLLEAIEAKDQKARAAYGSPWAADMGAHPNAVFIADNDPSSVLRHCEADRKLMARGGPFCSCYEYGPPTNPNTGLPIPHHYDCSAYEAATLLAGVYGITEEET
jgi:hypothetical protein